MFGTLLVVLLLAVLFYYYMFGFISRFRKIFLAKPVVKSRDPVRFGILGAARIAPMALIGPAKSDPNVVVLGVAARDFSRAAKFAEKHKIPKVHKSYNDLINDPEIDVIYNPLPNGNHLEWTLKALNAGKHVLCEKPLTANMEEAKILVDAAKKNNRVLVEAFHWRCHPLAKRAKKLVSELGPIKKITTKMTMPLWLLRKIFKDDIRVNFSLAGGLMMDMGCYTISALRFFSGEEPSEIISAEPVLVPGYDPQVDWGMKSTMKFPSGAIGYMECGGMPGIFNMNLLCATIEAEKGTLNVTWLAAPWAFSKIVVTKNGLTSTEYEYGNGTTYGYQLKNFCDQIRNPTEKISFPAEDAVANMKVIDDVYRRAGMKIRSSNYN